MLSHSVVSNSCKPMTVATNLLCRWDFPSKNTEWFAFSPLGNPPNPGIELVPPALASIFLTTEPGELPEKAMAPHSSTLAWKIPWMEEPGRLQSMGSLRVRHD